MNIAKKIKKAILTLGILGAMTNIASADALDDCRDILLSGSYSLKYENITPPPRQSMKEKQMLYDGKMYDLENPYTMYQPVAGIVAVSGGVRYVETNSAMNLQNVAVTKAQLQAQSAAAGSIGGLIGKSLSNSNKPREAEYATCTLTKNNEQFIFTRITSKDKVEYTGTKKGKVEAVKLKKGFKPGYAYDFGDRDVTKVLNAILPNDGKTEGIVTYRRVKSGTLPNGQYYVDLKAENLPSSTIFDAIRYYFENGTLVKIEAGQYYKTQTGRLDGVRTIINIYELNANPDSKYFKLPAGLTDVTKRNTNAKGAKKK